MGTWKTLVVACAVAFAVAGMTNFAQAGCGSCGPEKHDHEHEKKASCVKCDHKKVCESADCQDAAHNAECTCPPKATT